jgi:hypothetical protein
VGDIVEIPWTTTNGIVINKDGDINIFGYGIERSKIKYCRLVNRDGTNYTYTVSLDELYTTSPEERERLLNKQEE